MIVIGLGNPGAEYEQTRHNLGFRALDRLAELHGLTWKRDKSDDVLITSFGPHLLLKPQTLMNRSGQAFMQFWKYRCPDRKPVAEDVLVIHDDLDLPVGDIREQSNRSAAGHRGVESLIEALGSQNFHRIRIGIGNNREQHIPSEEYVLQPFPEMERPAINQAIASVVELLRTKMET